MTAPDAAIVRHPLAEAVTALAVTAGGPAVTGARYPAALRAEAAQLTGTLCDPDTAAALGGRIVEAGLYPTLSAVMRRDAGDPFGAGPDAALAALLDDEPPGPPPGGRPPDAPGGEPGPEGRP